MLGAPRTQVITPAGSLVGAQPETLVIRLVLKVTELLAVAAQVQAQVTPQVVLVVMA